MGVIIKIGTMIRIKKYGKTYGMMHFSAEKIDISTLKSTGSIHIEYKQIKQS